MKQILSALFFFTAISCLAQSPQRISYQVVLRDQSNNLVQALQVGMRISILQGSETGSAVYVETQTPTTNWNGLVSLEIGAGTTIAGEFSSINWVNGPYFIKTETDPNNGGVAANYSIVGTGPINSVPYALYAQNSGLHYLGETFNGGIIYYLYKGSDGLEHGLIVALTESTSVWQTTPAFSNANRTDDGAFNTALMTGSPAATYIASLGEGWYLPSIDELILLHHNRFIVQKALRNGQHTPFTGFNGNQVTYGSNYWSSTVDRDLVDQNQNVAGYTACAINFRDGVTNIFDRTYSNLVRGVRAF